MNSFKDIKHWIFDLDNTLYDASSHTFDQIEKRINNYVQTFFNLNEAEANKIRKNYYKKYGTTLKGMMTNYKIDHANYLDYVHDIDYKSIKEAPNILNKIESSKYKKYIFTNSTKKHASKVLNKLNLKINFDRIFDVVDANFYPKTYENAYNIFVKECSIVATEAIMFEDSLDNLKIPHKLGMITVLIREESKRDNINSKRKLGHIDYVFDSVESFFKNFK